MSAHGIVEGAHGVTTQRELGSTCAGYGGKPGQGYAAVLENETEVDIDENYLLCDPTRP